MKELIALVPAVMALILTPLLIRLWKKISSSSDVYESEDKQLDILRQRNGWLDNLFTILLFVGIFLPVLFMVPEQYRQGPAPIYLVVWILGSFGLMIDLPVIVIAAITFPKGLKRFSEFWCYYGLHWHVSMRRIAPVYTFIGIIGIVSITMLLVI
jgi:hypothetical protein